MKRTAIPSVLALGLVSALALGGCASPFPPSADALAKLPEADRAELIERAQAGENVSARDTAPAAPAPKPATAAPAMTPSMRLQMALVHGINRMLESAGVETVEEFVEQIMALPVRERDFMADQLDAFEYIGCLGCKRQSA